MLFESVPSTRQEVTACWLLALFLSWSKHTFDTAIFINMQEFCMVWEVMQRSRHDSVIDRDLHRRMQRKLWTSCEQSFVKLEDLQECINLCYKLSRKVRKGVHCYAMIWYSNKKTLNLVGCFFGLGSKLEGLKNIVNLRRQNYWLFCIRLFIVNLLTE